MANARSIKDSIRGYQYLDDEDKAKKETELQERFDNAVKDPSFRKRTCYSDDQVYAARNGAMRALEAAEVDARRCQEIFGEKAGIPGLSAVGRALVACESCDYSSPRIAEVVEKKRGGGE